MHGYNPGLESSQGFSITYNSIQENNKTNIFEKCPSTAGLSLFGKDFQLYDEVKPSGQACN